MSAPRPPVVVAPRGKSAVSKIRHTTAAAVKATIVDPFSSLANFVTLKGTPTITAGRLTGNGIAVRHRDELGSDDFKVTAVVGQRNVGKTWLVTSASETFDKFYALEVETMVSGGKISIVKSIALQETASSGLFGFLLNPLQIFLEVLADLFSQVIRWAPSTVDVVNTDSVAIWWDKAASTIRGYRNGVQVTSLSVPSWELPHGRGFRHFGVVTSPTGGVEFTSIRAEDV